MPDNLSYNNPSSGPPISTDYISITGVPQHLQRMKLGLGQKDEFQGDLQFGPAISASSVPVVLATDQTPLQVNASQNGNWMVGISGQPVVAAEQQGSWTVSVNNFPVATTIIGISGIPTVQQGSSPWIIGQGINPLAVAISGSLPAGSNTIGAVSQAGSWTVSVNNLPASQTVNGTVTADQGGPWAVSISGQPVSVNASQEGNWMVGISGDPSVSVSNFPASQSVTQGTDPWVINQGNNPLSVSISGQPVAVSQNGTWTVTVSNPTNATVVGISGQPTVSIVGTVTVDTELPSPVTLADSLANPTTPLVGSAALVWDSGVGGGWERWQTARSYQDAGSGVGLPVVQLVGYNGSTFDRLKSSSANGLEVDVTRVQGTVATSASQNGSWIVDAAVTGTVTSNQGGTWTVGITDYVARVAVTGVPHVIVDNAVTANIGTTNGLALDATLTGGTMVAKSVQSGPWSVAISGQPVSVSQNGSWSVSVSNFPATQAVTQSTSPWVISGSVTADTELPAATPLGDTISNPTAPMVGAANMVWDSGVGGGWERWQTARSYQDAGSGVGLPVIQIAGYNGSTFDRLKSTQANGLQVDVTRVQGNVSVSQNTNPWVVGGTIAVTGSLPAIQLMQDTVGSWRTGSKLITASGSAVQLTTSSYTADRGVQLKCSDQNTQIVWVGASGGISMGTSDAGDGFELYPGEALLVPVNNPNLIYAISVASGQRVFWSVQ